MCQGAGLDSTSPLGILSAVCGLLAYLRNPSADSSLSWWTRCRGARPTSCGTGARRAWNLGDDAADPASSSASTACRSSTSPISHQPLSWGPPEAPDRYKLVFNGEIYNYLELRDELSARHGVSFATDGDGEAILAGYHHWGVEVLNRLRGMFAFALWDTVDRELFCARDPFGIKPLFMATGTGGTIVGSEKKCLLDLADRGGHRPGIDERARPALHGAAVRAGARDAAPRDPTSRVGQLRPHPPGARRR